MKWLIYSNNMSDIKNLLLEKLKQKSPEELQHLHSVITELKKRENEDLAKEFIPNVKCEQFIKQVGENKAFINLFSAANGVGKSATLCNIVTNICFGPQNDYFKYPLFENFPYLKKGRIISDPTTIKEKIVPELKKWFPSNRYEVHYDTKKEGKNYEAKWTTDTGFEFDIMSNEQEAKEFESTDLGWCAFDEPSRKDIYLATVARMRRGGIIFWGMTPLSYSAWIKDDIYDKRDGKNIEYITATIWDNCKDIQGTRGILSRENIERMISQYPEDEKLARIEGQFGHLLGRVHKGFDRKVHVIAPFPITQRDYAVVKAHDTHPREDDHILWMAIDRKNQKFFIDELIIGGTTQEMAEAIKLKERIGGWNMLNDDLIDLSAFNTDERTGEKSVAIKFEEENIFYRPGSKDLSGCIRRMDDALKYEIRNEQMIVAPEIRWFDTCPVAIKQIENYVWDEYKGRMADDKQSKGKPKDKNDHQVENAHRLIKEEYQFKDTALIAKQIKPKQKLI